MNKKRWNENSSENIRTVKYPSGIIFEALHLYHTYTQLYLFVLPGFCIHHKAFPVHCDWLISDLIPKKSEKFEFLTKIPSKIGPKFKIWIFENGRKSRKMVEKWSKNGRKMVEKLVENLENWSKNWPKNCWMKFQISDWYIYPKNEIFKISCQKWSFSPRNWPYLA